MFYDLFEIVFLIPVILIGFFCIFTDFKYKKIYNNAIVAGLLYGLFFFIYFLIQEQNLLYIQSVLINFIISIILSYFFWFFKFWTAGNAKLFSLFCFLLPLSFYEHTNFPYFPSLNILINFFALLMVFLLVLSIINIFKQNFFLKNFIGHITSFFKTSFIYVFVFILIRKILEQFEISNFLFFPILYFLFMFLTINFLKRILEKHFIINYLFIVVTIIYSFYLVLNGDEDLLSSVFLRVYAFLSVIYLFRILINDYVNDDSVIKREGENTIFNNAQTNNSLNIFKKETYNLLSFPLIFYLSIILTIFLRQSILIFFHT